MMGLATTRALNLSNQKPKVAPRSTSRGSCHAPQRWTEAGSCADQLSGLKGSTLAFSGD